MLNDSISELVAVLSELEGSITEQYLNDVVSAITICLKRGNKILLIGNGGSAAEAQHMAAEYAATLSCKNFRDGFPAIALTTDTSFLTAWSNDFGVQDIFSRQVETLGSEGDVLFAYSTSGNSENVIRAVKAANKKNIKVISFLGNDGGLILGNSDWYLLAPSTNTARIQECHTLLGHTICSMVEKEMGYIF